MDLKSSRESRGLSQQELADAVGLKSKSYISSLESGAWPCTLKLALKLEDFFDGEILAIDLLVGDEAALLKRAIARAALTSIPSPAEAAA